MPVNNVSTFGSLQTLLQNMSQVQSNLTDVQQQISSGEVSQNFQGLGGNVEQFTSLNAQLARLTDFQNNNSGIISQMQAGNSALTQIIQVANNVKSLVASQTSDFSSTASFQQQLQAQLTALTTALNTTYGASYVFGGTNTSTPPIKSTLPQPATIGVPDDSYYQGSSQNVTFRVGDNETITQGIRADNTAFQQLYAGIQQALSTTQSSGSGTNGDPTTALTNAESLVESGLQQVIGLQATVNANIVNIQQVNTNAQSTQTYLKGLVSNISSADVVSLSTQVAQDQSVLEATYATFARISSLSLVHYLPTG